MYSIQTLECVTSSSLLHLLRISLLIVSFLSIQSSKLDPPPFSPISGTAEHCCICIPGCACVERFVTCLRPLSPHLMQFLIRPLHPQPNGWATNPPIHEQRVPSSEGKYVRAHGSTNWDTHWAFMAPPPLALC